MTPAQAAPGLRAPATAASVSSAALAKYPFLRHASTTRNFSLPGAPRLEEFAAMRQLLGAPSSFLVYAEQKHTNNVGVVTPEILNEFQHESRHCFPNTDAMVCPIKNVILAIQTADCAPIFLADPVREIIAIAHAGWKGTLARIAENTIATMTSLGANPRDIVAWIGPMAGVCCYEVSDELIEQFQTEFASVPHESIHRGRHLDLVQINKMQLAKTGIPESNIHSSDICTIHNHDQFYSYRADGGATGRIISAITMPGNIPCPSSPSR